MVSHGGHVVAILVHCVAICSLLVVQSVDTSTAQVMDVSEKTYSICARRCMTSSNNGDRQTLEACMLRCRNYVEQAMFRPRLPQPSKVDDSKAVLDVGRYTRGSGARNHMFVRVGKSYDSESENEDAAKQSGQLTRDSDGLNDYDVTKRRTAGFVRIGRRGPNQQFVRIGRDPMIDGLEDSEGDELQEEVDKRGKGQAFVRIGRKSANFVRIGKAFVRIGKNDVGASSAVPDVESESVVAASDEA